jgi:Peptidase family M28
MADVELVHRAKALLDRIAEKPRFAGGADEALARDICRAELERAGFTCRERPFDFSEWPARWGPPLAALVQLVIVVVAAWLADRGDAPLGLVIVVAAVILLPGVAARVRQQSVVTSPYMRARSINLEATRGAPSVWLVAHLDSKSQAVPILVRIVSSVALQIASGLILLALILSMIGATIERDAWLALTSATVVAALPTLFCFVRNDSPGAVDNASGVTAVVLAATRSDSPPDLGVLITSAEELGLAGARVWALAASGDIKVLNCDTVDDVGSWRCMYNRARPRPITSAAKKVAGVLGVALRITRLIPGILADNVAFADVRIKAVTISRGNFSTLARIHTWRDNSIAQTGRGAVEASVLLSALAKELV